jgi:hypothetical protein
LLDDLAEELLPPSRLFINTKKALWSFQEQGDAEWAVEGRR